MKNLLEAAEDYTKQAGWRDLAELKCCMCALGLLLGLAVPRRWRKKAVTLKVAADVTCAGAHGVHLNNLVCHAIGKNSLYSFHLHQHLSLFQPQHILHCQTRQLHHIDHLLIEYLTAFYNLLPL